MLYLISYDVSTVDKAGSVRLRRVAKCCENYGIRVQNSVFECEMSYEIYLSMREKLSKLIKPAVDSLRIYPMGKNGRAKVVHIGVNHAIDMNDSLIY